VSQNTMRSAFDVITRLTLEEIIKLRARIAQLIASIFPKKLAQGVFVQLSDSQRKLIFGHVSSYIENANSLSL